MDIRSNEPFWLIKNALPKSYPSLDKNIDTDILVIGGGITGALISYQLLKEGFKVVLIDRRDICNGSTAASTSMLQYEIDVPLHELIKISGSSSAISSYKNCEQAINTIHNLVKEIQSDCHFEFKKSIYFCNTEKDVAFLKKEFDCRKENGFEVSWLSKQDLKKMGLEAYAAIQSNSGAIMDAFKFANDLLKHSTENHGLKIFDRTEAKSIRHLKSGININTNTVFRIHAKHVVHCTGYESIETVKENIVNLKSTYALASEAFNELPNPFKNNIFWNTSQPYLYFRSTHDNRIIMGGGDEDFQDASKRDSLLKEKENDLVVAFKKCFPKIDFKLDYSWAGTFGETKDGLPYMGKPYLHKNEHYILGFGGNGITFSIMGMEAIKNSIQQKFHPFLEHYNFER